jgi:hypothetical protein
MQSSDCSKTARTARTEKYAWIRVTGPNTTSKPLDLGDVARNMADEDAGRTRPRERGSHDRGSHDPNPHERDEETGFSFSLPPILLPDMELPERIGLAFSTLDPPEKVSRPTRVRVSWLLLGVVLVDALDAFAVIWTGPETLAWTRAALGLLLGVVFVGGPGLLYAWELFAILGGVGWLSVAPTLTALVLGQVLLSE